VSQSIQFIYSPLEIQDNVVTKDNILFIGMYLVLLKI